jgi:hypothetical protein
LQRHASRSWRCRRHEESVDGSPAPRNEEREMAPRLPARSVRNTNASTVFLTKRRVLRTLSHPSRLRCSRSNLFPSAPPTRKLAREFASPSIRWNRCTRRSPRALPG